MTRQEFVASLRRSVSYLLYMNPGTWSANQSSNQLMLMLFDVCMCRKSSGFSRGASIYRGVTRYARASFSWLRASYGAEVVRIILTLAT